MLLEDSKDNRKSIREKLHLPVKLEIVRSKDSAANMFLGYTFNVSRHGIALDIAPDFPMGTNPEVLLHLDNSNPSEFIQIPAKVIWTGDSQCGLQFLQEHHDLRELIREASEKFNMDHPVSLKKFFPYVDGQDVDTKQYKYFPYADKFLTDFNKVVRYKNLLKRGDTPKDAGTYLYAQYALADAELNRRAIASAHRAFQEYSIFSLERRRKILDDVRDLLIKEKENMIDLMVIEGHPRKLAEWELYGMIAAFQKESLDFFEDESLRTLGQSGDETIILVRRPEGVVCVSPPKNASGSISLMASFALLAGNTLVIKPPFQMPISTIYLWRNIVGKVLQMNGAPKGTINIVIGDSSSFMEEWLINPYVRAIFFFGDSNAGLEIGKRIYNSGKKPLLELTGNDFLAVWNDAPVEKAADSLLDCFMGSTQICMVPKKALIHADIYDQFMRVFLAKVKKLKVGLPSDPDTILSPVGKIADYFDSLDDAVRNGAKLLMGGYRMNHHGEKDENGFYIAPTVIEVPFERASMMKCINEENFFPLLPVIRVEGGGLTIMEKNNRVFSNMLHIIKSNQYGLRMSVWVRDQHFLKKFIEEADHCGVLRINSRHIGFSPYLAGNGGIGKSGGPFGEMNYVWQKLSHLQGISVTRLDIKDDAASADLNVIYKEKPRME